ncbi:hypothetical protein SAMN06295974_1930 [Plantibacter flavus]|uniref:Plasmid maintenance system killer protein n=1 Tax=Plantibacter flavus TaxID=150123 RepID=A0A3N2BXN7_9MICO|nr:hypothetical protein [Plantibacter flavus]ROR80035.1 hypothetical protein EDD42_0067 [Plantibacter flavus]SMG28844.1 hypothetical protein SAMN06295974_1930 [Plantibacter flavus]
MAFELKFTREADAQVQALNTPAQQKKLRKVQRALARLELDPRYPSLHSHKYSSLSGSQGEEVWDSYVENHTPGAWRIFWHYGPGSNTITVVSITPHPN